MGQLTTPMTSDDGRAHHSQPRELLTLIIGRCVDVGLSLLCRALLTTTHFLARSQLFLLSPGQTPPALNDTHKVHTLTHILKHTHTRTFLVMPWLLVHSVQ